VGVAPLKLNVGASAQQIVESRDMHLINEADYTSNIPTLVTGSFEKGDARELHGDLLERATPRAGAIWERGYCH